MLKLELDLLKIKGFVRLHVFLKGHQNIITLEDILVIIDQSKRQFPQYPKS